MKNVVTGSFGYIGKYITKHLLEQGEDVVTITTHVDKPNPFGNVVRAFPYNFDKPDRLIETLRGVDTLYNTYWIRFEYKGATFHEAIQNTVMLFNCARVAGVQKVVHISVSNASSVSTLPYYSGKGDQEKALIDSGIPYSIVRPTLVFGKEDILVNNIGWLIRKFPVFPIFGDGSYRVQPVFVEDLASIAIKSAREKQSAILDAIGPESYSFREFVQLIASKIKPDISLIHCSPAIGIFLGRLIGLVLKDNILTRDELNGFMMGMLTSNQHPNGMTRFSDWLEANKQIIGSAYSSEIARHFTWKNRN
ncbi:MAG: NAD-dependent epimerase/dehydratase family protein [Ignavibacteriales bacterium]|nr:NAD-dependent epimerase/dehydratase family protein [Ignavibacteriales bacterium]